MPGTFGKTINVSRALLYPAGNITITFLESLGTSTTTHMGPFALTVNTPLVWFDINMSEPYITTAPGASLAMVTSNKQQVSGQIGFYYA